MEIFFPSPKHPAAQHRDVFAQLLRSANVVRLRGLSADLRLETFCCLNFLVETRSRGRSDPFQNNNNNSALRNPDVTLLQVDPAVKCSSALISPPREKKKNIACPPQCEVKER